MIARPQAERMLTDDERGLLELATADDRARSTLAEIGGGWTWEFRSLSAPRMFDTKAEALQSLNARITLLLEAARVESERRYTVEPSDG